MRARTGRRSLPTRKGSGAGPQSRKRQGRTSSAGTDAGTRDSMRDGTRWNGRSKPALCGTSEASGASPPAHSPNGEKLPVASLWHWMRSTVTRSAQRLQIVHCMGITLPWFPMGLVVNVKALLRAAPNALPSVPLKSLLSVPNPLARTTDRTPWLEVRVLRSLNMKRLPLPIAPETAEGAALLRPFRHVRLPRKLHLALSALKENAARLVRLSALPRAVPSRSVRAIILRFKRLPAPETVFRVHASIIA